MKAILYMSAVLMTGAIIYGFVDFRQTNKSQDFQRLYHQTETTEPVAVILESKTVAVIEKMGSDVKKERVAVKRNNLKHNREVNHSKSSKRDIIPVTPISIEKEEKPITFLKDEKTESGLKEIKKNKRINHRMFSRAALKSEPATQKTKKRKE